MFRKLREFHERTMEIYKQGIEEEMEPWKKKVLLLHEKADYLFYVDDIATGKEKGSCTIRGEIVRGGKEIGEELLLLNGEGTLIARGLLESDISEKEENRRGIHRKRNEFRIKLFSIKNQVLADIDDAQCRRLARSLAMELSLITDVKSWEMIQ